LTRLWHELAVPALVLAAVALAVYLLGLEPWRDPAGTH